MPVLDILMGYYFARQVPVYSPQGVQRAGALGSGPEVREIASRVAAQLASTVVGIRMNLRRYVVVITDPNGTQENGLLN